MAESLFQTADLQSVKVREGNLEQFQNIFQCVRSHMRRVPSEDTLRFTYYEALKNQPALQEDLCHFMRVGRRSP